MDNPLVSVIIPIYNVSQYLKQCLDSIINQTYKNLEIILVNDGSTDNSGKICDKYAETDSRITVIHQKNKGQAYARNEAIKLSNGSFVLYVDGDDYISSTHIQLLVSASIKYNADIVQCSMIKFSEKRNLRKILKKKKISTTEQVYTASSALKEFCYQKKFTASPVCKLINKNLMNGLEFPVGIGYEDLAIVYKLLGRSSRQIVFIPEMNYYYRQHQNSTMHAKFTEKKIDRIKIAEQFLNYIKKYYPELTISAYTRYSLAQLQLLMELPFDKKYKNIRNIAFNNLRLSRSKVLHDKYAPYKLKFMIATTYLGPKTVMYLGRMYNKIMFV